VLIVIALALWGADETPRDAEPPAAGPVAPAAPRDMPSTPETPAGTTAPRQPQSVPAPPEAPASTTSPAASPPAPTEPLREAERVEATPAGADRPTVDTAQLCRELSTSGAWRCEPTAAPASPGVLYFYSRLKSPRDTSVEHRWYFGNRLRRSVTLQIRANMYAGYRTYSRQAIRQRGRWRVELRASDGTVLHEESFDVE
jgi:hypothetical protein